jgi:UDP-sulfoquinovose synthase
VRILILGGDGYLGWPTAMHLTSRGFEVAVADNYFRRTACHALDIEPLIPTPNLHQRAALWRERTGHDIAVAIGDVTDYSFLASCFTGEAFDRSFQPDAVIHYAEQPSAPYSMMDREKAAFTLSNNLQGTLNLVFAVRDLAPACHIVKLGTMGVYGTPNIDIEEGYLTVQHKGRQETFLYPRTPGSLYHLTKAQDGDLLSFACRIWDLAVTDLNQGPVYGLFTEHSRDDDRLATIFNYDDIMGTVLNRFLVQAVAGHPLTVYGAGGQTRGYLNLMDTMQCVELALRSPAPAGTYRVFNQFVETFSVNDLAARVLEAGRAMGLEVKIQTIPNPRREAENHYYNPVHTGLLELGLSPHPLTPEVLAGMLGFVLRHQDAINPRLIMPRVQWTKR